MTRSNWKRPIDRGIVAPAPPRQAVRTQFYKTHIAQIDTVF